MRQKGLVGVLAGTVPAVDRLAPELGPVPQNGTAILGNLEITKKQVLLIL